MKINKYQEKPGDQWLAQFVELKQNENWRS